MKSLNKALRLLSASRKVTLGLASVSILSLSLFACGGRGDTGNENDPNAGPGSPFVSNGASGSTMTIEIEGGGNEIGVTDRVDFKVTALDPSGLPLSHIRLFCESESGIAIIEPSSGGVAFEHTNANGVMSGVLGGLAPGSFLLECRAPQGFNLVARKSFKVTGEIPEGFDGFPGAAGGNLGGGVLVEPPGEDVTVTEILFNSVLNPEPTRILDMDTVSVGYGCPPNNTLELFGPDNFFIQVRNNLDQRVRVLSVSLVTPGGVTSEQQLGSLSIQPNSEVQFSGPFTAFGGAGKVYAGTNESVSNGVFNIPFTVTFITANGERVSTTRSATIRAYNVNGCQG